MIYTIAGIAGCLLVIVLALYILRLVWYQFRLERNTFLNEHTYFDEWIVDGTRYIRERIISVGYWEIYKEHDILHLGEWEIARKQIEGAKNANLNRPGRQR